MNPKVDAYLGKTKRWRAEFEALRQIALGCDLTEEFKWGNPCYTFRDSNIVLMHGFKEYCALLFFKGALMEDAKGILIAQTENTQAARQIRFSSVEDIVGQASVLKSCIQEAIKVEQAGLKVGFKKTADFKMPEEFRSRLDESPALKSAFAALTPGRQRAYLLHFAGAKQSGTRTCRVDKCIAQILDGKGLDD